MTPSEPHGEIRRLEFRGAVGPITRSTVGPGSVEPRAQALNDALHWIWSWQIQAQRLVESMASDASGGTMLEVRKSSSRASFDEHMLAVTGWNLVRAITSVSRSFPDVRVDSTPSDAFRLLRNLYEHWDEQRGVFQDPSREKSRSAAEFATKFPHGRPWSLTFGSNDWVLAGVVPLAQLSQSLHALEERLLDLQRQLEAR